MAQLFGGALAEFRCFRRVVFAVLDPKMARTFGEEFQVPVEGLDGEIGKTFGVDEIGKWTGLLNGGNCGNSGGNCGTLGGN